jgi:hypothetical protein
MPRHVSSRQLKKLIALCIILFALTNLFPSSVFSRFKTKDALNGQETAEALYDMDSIKRMPMVFIGGHERSGANLMRSLLAFHDGVNCRPDEEIFTQFFQYAFQLTMSSNQADSIREAGLDRTKVKFF